MAGRLALVKPPRAKSKPRPVKGNISRLAPALPADDGPLMLLVGWTTVAKRDEAEQLARGLIGARLAACVQVEGPITSFYVWEGQAAQEEEFRLCVKFVPSQAAMLEAWLQKHHPYKTPEWVVVRAEHVAEKYLSWARANSTSAPL